MTFLSYLLYIIFFYNIQTLNIKIYFIFTQHHSKKKIEIIFYFRDLRKFSLGCFTIVIIIIIKDEGNSAPVKDLFI